MSLSAVIEIKNKEVYSVLEEIKTAKEGSYIHRLNERVAHLIWRKKINGNESSCEDDWNCAQKKINEFVMKKFQTYGESFELVLKRHINSTAYYYNIYRNGSSSLEDCKKDAIEEIALMTFF